MSRNPQTEAAKAAAQKQDSTHSDAAQASAARLIRALRNTYPEIINTEIETTPDTKNAQQYLIDYLTYLTTKNNSFEKNVRLSRHPAIVATLRSIDHIADNYSDPDKMNVLFKMLAIANTHPNFKQWSDSDKQWSQNKIYKVVTEEGSDVVKVSTDIVTASPAETLNLVCTSFFDHKHMVPPLPKSNIDKDRADHIHSLFVYLRNLYHEEKTGNYTICAAGRQHGMLFLLNHVFCERPHQAPIVLIEDQHTFTLNMLFEFIKIQLEAVPEKLSEVEAARKKSSEAVSDWVLYQFGMVEREVAPVITFLRHRFPSEQKDNPDIKWREALDAYLKNQFSVFGLNPETCQSGAMADNIGFIQPPTVNPLLMELLKCQPLSAAGSLQSLAEKRNHTLEALRERYKSNAALSSDEILSLHLAEILFQKLYQHRYHALLIDSDDPTYQIAIKNTEAELMHIFQTHSRSPQFKAIQAAYQKQLNQLKHYDLIENIFVNGETVEQNLAIIQEEIKKLPEGSRNPFLITDDTLERWLVENTSSEFPGAIDASPFEINRILLHALLTKDQPNEHNSPLFSQVLELILNWIAEPEQPTDAENKKALKKAYESQLRQNMIDFMTDLSPDGIRRICAMPNMPRKIINSLGTNDDEVQKKLANFINNNNPQKICALLENIFTKKENLNLVAYNYHSSDSFLSLLSKITFDKVELVFELLKNRLAKEIKLPFHEFLGLSKLHYEALNELQHEGLTPYHFLKWAPIQVFSQPFQESHKKALIYLVKIKKWTPAKAINELKKLNYEQVLRISAGFSRDDVHNLTEYKLQALEKLHQDGLTGDLLRSFKENYSGLKFEEAHINALIHYIRVEHLSPADAIAKINGLESDEVKAILAGFTRDEIRPLNRIQLETLLELHKEGLTAVDLQGWQKDRQTERFSEQHKNALIFLIRVDQMISRYAVEAISKPMTDALLKILASFIDKRIKKVIIENKEKFEVLNKLCNIEKIVLFDADKIELIIKNIFNIRGWINTYKIFTIDTFLEMPLQTLHLFIKHSPHSVGRLFDLKIDLTQFLTLDPADMELMFKHYDKVEKIVPRDGGKNFQINEIMALLKKKINEEFVQHTAPTSLGRDTLFAPPAMSNLTRIPTKRERDGTQGFFSLGADFHELLYREYSQNASSTPASSFFRPQTQVAQNMSLSLSLLIANHKLTVEEEIRLTEQERRNLATPRISQFVANNTLTVSSAKLLTEEQRVRLENGEDLQRVIARRGPSIAELD